MPDNDNPPDSQSDDENRFVTSEKRPDHAQGANETDTEADRPDDAAGEAGDVPAMAERPTESEPSEEFLDSVDDELRQKFEEVDEQPSDEDADGVEADTTRSAGASGIQTPDDLPDSPDEADVSETDEVTEPEDPQPQKNALKQQAGQINQESESSGTDPLDEYRNQDLSSLKEAPDAYEYTHRGIHFLMIPPDPDDDSEAVTDAREEFQRAQAAIRKAQDGDALTDEEAEDIERMQKLVVQRTVVAPEIDDETWYDWPDGTQQALFSASTEYLNDIVSGYRGKRKSGLDPTALR